MSPAPKMTKTQPTGLTPSFAVGSVSVGGKEAADVVVEGEGRVTAELVGDGTDVADGSGGVGEEVGSSEGAGVSGGEVGVMVGDDVGVGDDVADGVGVAPLQWSSFTPPSKGPCSSQSCP